MGLLQQVLGDGTRGGALKLLQELALQAMGWQTIHLISPAGLAPTTRQRTSQEVSDCAARTIISTATATRIGHSRTVAEAKVVTMAVVWRQ